MLDVRTQVVRRSLLVIAAILLSGPTGVGASPVQEEPAEDERESADRALVGADASAGPAEVAGALEAMQENVQAQLDQLSVAETNVANAQSALADAEAVVSNTELRIEELDAQSDAVVVEAFVNPSVQEGVEVFGVESLEEATIKQTILDVHAQASADALDELEEQTAALEEQREIQAAALEEAEGARSDAEAALADLEAAVDEQTRFVLDVRARLAGDVAAAEAEADPEVAEQIRARAAEIQAAIDAAAEAAEFAAAMERLAEAERIARERGIWVCPVDGDVSFDDTWGAARSGGRSHKGTDMMAAHGTPTVAPVAGRVEHRGTSLGGLSWYVYADNGDMFYGTHLQGYANTGAGHVERGTVIGYVGSSGNATADAPHLHFEYHPGGGSAVNPYDRLVEVC